MVAVAAEIEANRIMTTVDMDANGAIDILNLSQLQ
jgi:hypothetical protein